MEVIVARLLIGAVIILIGAALWSFTISANHGCYPWQEATRPPDVAAKVRNTVCR